MSDRPPDLVRDAFVGERLQARIWRVGLGLMVGLLGFTVSLIPLVNAVYDARLERDAARSPFVSPASVEEMARGELVWSPDDPRVWYNLKFAFADGPSYIDVLSFLPPVGSTVAPPPGIPRWPSAGEVYATEAVLANSSDRAFAEAYGEIVGIIDTAVLADPGERIIYVGIDRSQLSPPGFWLPVDSFGVPVGIDGDAGQLGSALRQASRLTFIVAIAAFAIAPGMLLAGVVARLGGDRRDRTIRIVRRLGGSAWQVAMKVARGIAPPIGLGTLGAVGVMGVMALTGTTVPLVGYQLVAADVRAGLGWVLAAIVATGSTALFCGVIAHKPWQVREPNRIVRLRRPARAGAPVLLMLAIAVSNWGEIVFGASNPQVALLIRLVCLAAAVTVLPASMAPLIAVAGRGLGAVARLVSSAPLLVSGKELRRHGQASIRVAAILGMFAVVGLQVQVMVTTADTNVERAGRFMVANAGRVLMTSSVSATADPAWVGEMLVEDEPEYATLLFTPGTEPELLGTCENLLTAVADCSSGGTVADAGLLSQPLEYYGITPTTRIAVVTSPDAVQIPPDSEAMLLFVSRAGTALSRERILANLGQVVQPIPLVEAVGESATVGANIGARHALWLAPAMLLNFAFGLIAASVATLLEMVRSRERMRSFVRIANVRQLASFSAGFIGAPILTMAISGVAIGTALVTAKISDPADPAKVSGSGIAALLLLGLAGAVVASGVGTALLAAGGVRAGVGRSGDGGSGESG